MAFNVPAAKDASTTQRDRQLTPRPCITMCLIASELPIWRASAN